MKMHKNFSIDTEKSDKSPNTVKKHSDRLIPYGVEDSLTCGCNLCIAAQKKKIPIPIEELNQIKQKPQSNDRDFIFVVLRLVQDQFIRTLNIQIQDTIYFEKGEPQTIIQSIKDGIDKPYQLRIQQWKGSLQKLMQYMNARRKKVNTTNQQLDLIQLMDKQQSQIGNSNKEGNSNVTEKSKEAVLIKFDDDTSQIMTEQEFYSLMSKRRGDKIWFKIFYIQNYIKQKAFITHRIKFNRYQDEQSKLFIRSSMETRIIRGEIIQASSEFINQKEEDEFLRILKDKNILEFIKYLSYKIVQFLDILDDTLINQAIFEWQQDDRNEFQLFDVNNILYEKRIKEEKQQQQQKQQIQSDDSEIEEIDTKQMFNKKYQLKVIAKNARRKLKMKQQHAIYKDCPRVTLWQKEMLADYHTLLQSVGIDKNQFTVKEDNQSELTFKYLHPDLNIDFQKLMKDQQLFNRLKKQLFTENSKAKPMSESKMLNSFFLTPQKHRGRNLSSTKPKQDLISTLNQSSIKKSAKSVDRTVSEFRYDFSRNGKRSSHTLNKLLGLANS